MLYNIYLVSLLVGVIYSAVSFIANGILDGFDIDFDMFSLPLKPFTLISFVTVFGGVGLIMMHVMYPVLTLIPAILLGYIVSKVLYHLFYIKLKGMETETNKEQDALYQKAEVVEKILPNGYGKISYVVDGNILSAPAKERGGGNGIAKGAMVFIIEIRDNVCYVIKYMDGDKIGNN